MYIVTKNNPFYPSVTYFVNLKDANEYRDELMKEWEDDKKEECEGKYECQVTVAKVIETFTVNTSY